MSVDAGIAAEHVGLLQKACLSTAYLEALDDKKGRPCDPALRQQLCSLTATLLRSVHPELMIGLSKASCNSIVQVGTS